MARGLLSLLPLLILSTEATSSNSTSARDKKVFALFSVVQFPNDVCTTSVGTSIFGTCLTASECTAASGTASGNCAAGFGVCCYIATSTCSTSVTRNNTYLQNPTYPSSYTPSSASTSTCTFTIQKVNSNICQLRLDFQTFSGFTVSTAGVCTDFVTVKGQTGYNPPVLCGTQTGYHMYVEYGASATDTASVSFTYASTTPAKQFNVFAQQIECTAPWRAPTDCTQYYTGTSGRIQSYGWAGAQLIKNMEYDFCVRREAGYCSISYTETTGTTIDSFSLLDPTSIATAISNPTVCSPTKVYLVIPKTSGDGITPLSVQPANGAPTVEPFPNVFCGAFFGVTGATSSQKLTTQSFTGSVLTTGTITAPSTGFSLDYTQNACQS